MLEEENEYLLTTTKGEEDDNQPTLLRYINYIMHIIENLDNSHFARSCFEERFLNKKSVYNLAEGHNYNMLALKAFKFITDLLINLSNSSPKAKHHISPDKKSFVNEFLKTYDQANFADTSSAIESH
jgi:hypothetical protein